MINFYSFSQDCHQLNFGDMTIYYSFKMPCVYRTAMHGVRVRKDMFIGVWGAKVRRHVEEILIGKNYVLCDKDAFICNLNEQFKREILSMAKKVAMEGLKLC